MRQVMRYNNKNWPLYIKPAVPYQNLPLGMKVYDGDVQIGYKFPTQQTGYTTTIYYSIDSTSNWQTMPNYSTASQRINVNSGSTIYFYGPLGNKVSEEYIGSVFTITGSGKIDLIGNMLSICNPNWTENIELNPRNAGYLDALFANNSQIRNAKDLYIRTTKAYTGGYNITFGYVFQNCTNLLTGPNWICGDNNDLAINSVAAFISMFEGCTSLTSAIMPPVKTTSGASRVYETMFKNCTSLTDITYAGTLGINNTNFSQNLPASGTFHNLSGATYVTGSSGIPSGWTVQDA